MAEKNDESKGAAGLSGAGTGGTVPAGKGILAVLSCNSEVAVQQAMASAMQAGAVTAAQLAARKPAAVGAPLPVATAAPAPAAMQPVAASRAAVMYAGGVSDGRPTTALVPMTAKFALTMSASLAELSAGTASAAQRFSIDLPSYAKGSNVVLRAVTVTRSSSSSQMPLGLRLDDMPARFVQSLPNGRKGSAYHMSLPRGSQPACTKKQEVCCVQEGVIDPAHIATYGQFRTREDLLAQVSMDEKTGYTAVPLSSAIGYVFAKNGKHGHLEVKTTTDGKPFFHVETAQVVAIADKIHSEILSNEAFRRMLTDLKAFSASLVPLNVSGEWTDVPELNVESPDARQAELERRFLVSIEGEMSLLLIPSQPADQTVNAPIRN
jgi:hypothetical protein